MAKKSTKQKARKKVIRKIWSDEDCWRVNFGRMVPPAGRPPGVPSLFSVVGEKLPFACIDEVRRDMIARSISTDGVYIAHDSMGCPRYIGRGKVFARLKARKRRQQLELTYFSFYIVTNKKHEREVETLLIRAASPLLYFNERKKRVDIEAGSVWDYEAGTRFYQRRWQRGAKPR